MGPGDRRLIVNADDFGRSRSINQAVIRAHQEGILTTASLMVNGDACAQAVELARENPRLGVGLHLTLVCGSATLPPAAIPDLVDSSGRFSDDPARTGAAYFFRRGLVPQLCREMAAQFEKFRQFNLTLDHVNGHLNLHLHPTILQILLAQAEAWGLTRIRWTRDPFWLNAALARGQWIYRVSHAVIFFALSARARPRLARQRIRHTQAVFGLLQNARVDARFLARLLPRLPAGDSELYSHPSLDEFRREFEALIDPRTRRLVQEHHIQLIRYQDL